MKRLFAIALFFITSVAYADPAQSVTTNVDTQSGAQASNQGNSQSVNISSPANTTSTVVTTGKQDLHYSGQFRTVPNVYAPPVGVTAPCIVGISGGLSIIGFGVSGGTGKEDKGCTKRENARMLYSFGETKGAVALLCQDKSVYAAMMERCDLALAREKIEIDETNLTEQVPVEVVHTTKRNHE